MCWCELRFVLSVRSALAEMLTFFSMILIKRQNKYFDDVMVVTACDLAGKEMTLKPGLLKL